MTKRESSSYRNEPVKANDTFRLSTGGEHGKRAGSCELGVSGDDGEIVAGFVIGVVAAGVVDADINGFVVPDDGGVVFDVFELLLILLLDFPIKKKINLCGFYLFIYPKKKNINNNNNR